MRHFEPSYVLPDITNYSYRRVKRVAERSRYPSRARSPSMESPINIREAVIDDVDELVRLRCELWNAVGEPTPTPELIEATRSYFSRHVGSKNFITLVLHSGTEIISVGTVHCFERLPYAGNLSGKEFYLLNMYTRPQYERRGYASKIIDNFRRLAQEQKVGRIWLHASNIGRPVYERAGYISRDGEMELKL